MVNGAGRRQGAARGDTRSYGAVRCMQGSGQHGYFSDDRDVDIGMDQPVEEASLAGAAASA